MKTDLLEGGVAAAKGFQVAATHCGIKTEGLDLALIVSDGPASGAAVFTTNLVIAAPVVVSKQHLSQSGGLVRAIAVNSGCANACTGDAGLSAARAMATTVSKTLDCQLEHALIASTGVIGLPLDSSKIHQGIVTAAGRLNRTAHTAAAEAIMTTDRGPKEAAIQINTSEGSFVIGGMVKGAGMIEPNLATMLGFLTTDAKIEPGLLREALVAAVADTFNAITVDGECSTNDAVFLLASGCSEVSVDEVIYPTFVEGLREVCATLAREIVRGGEGATKLIAVRVTGGHSPEEAKCAARAIANSLLVKTAVNGSDPNWGRIIAALGRSGATVEEDKLALYVNDVCIMENGLPVPFFKDSIVLQMKSPEVSFRVHLNIGQGQATAWGCDLSEGYVITNSAYTT